MTNSAISEFMENNFQNDLFWDAVRQRKNDVALEVFKQDNFELDIYRTIDNGDNILIWAIKNKARDVIDHIFKLPKESIEALVNYKNSNNNNSNALFYAVNNNDIETIKQIKELGFSISPETIDLYNLNADQVEIETLQTLDWDKDLLNLKELHRFDGKIFNYISYGIKYREATSLVKKLIQLEEFDPFYQDDKTALRPYFTSRYYKHRQHVEGISNLILKKMHELDPKKAKKIASGFLGLRGHKLKP